MMIVIAHRLFSMDPGLGLHGLDRAGGRFIPGLDGSAGGIDDDFVRATARTQPNSGSCEFDPNATAFVRQRLRIYLDLRRPERRLIAIFVADVEANKTTSWECWLFDAFETCRSTDPTSPS
jgi:hypothetical protein